ncbi:hypothetical protein ERJ75_001813500 [Trypanosoma vivax]|nr:hypothetical protein ERJ75_001813500 [Trypanosoma vivax]
MSYAAEKMDPGRETGDCKLQESASARSSQTEWRDAMKEATFNGQSKSRRGTPFSNVAKSCETIRGRTWSRKANANTRRSNYTSAANNEADINTLQLNKAPRAKRDTNKTWNHQMERQHPWSTTLDFSESHSPRGDAPRCLYGAPVGETQRHVEC